MSEQESCQWLCPSEALREAADAVGFDVLYGGQTCRAFAVRYQGKVFAYLNRCQHIPIELDYQPNRFFDAFGNWLVCATHGALYEPSTGACVGGPCRSGLVSIITSEADGFVHWHTSHNLKPVNF